MTGRTTDPVTVTARVYDAKAAEFARNWDRLPRRDNDPVTMLLARLPPHATVLDVGSGSGRDLERIRAAGHHAVGLDRSEGLAGIADRRAPVMVADARAIPVADGRLDGVLASASLLHLPRTDMPRALAECRRVLRPGGVLVLSVKAGDGAYTDEAGRCFTLWRAEGLDVAMARAGLEVSVGTEDPDQLGGPQAWLVRVARPA